LSPDAIEDAWSEGMAMDHSEAVAYGREIDSRPPDDS
jgi:hypothetical protein